MSFGDRVLNGLKTIVLIEERTNAMSDAFKAFKQKAELVFEDHEKRLTRLETMVEIIRPDGGVLRITPPSKPQT